MNILKLTLFCIIFPCLLFSQKGGIDSLKQKLSHATTNEQRLHILSELANLLDDQGTAKEGLPIFNNLLELSVKTNNKVIQSMAYRYIAEANVKLNDSVSAILNAKKAIALSNSINDVDEHIASMDKLGRVYIYFRNPNSAVEIFNKVLNRYKNKNDSINSRLTKIYTSLGRAHGDLGDSNKQISLYLEGARLADIYEDYEAKNYINYLIGWIYMDLEQHDKAEKYYFKALEDSTNFTASFYTTRIFHALGVNYSRAEDFKKALSYNFKALKRFQKEGDKLYEFDVLNNTAVIYQRKNVPDSIIFYAERALKVAKELDHAIAIAAAKNTLSAAYLEQKKYYKAKQMLLEIAKDTIKKNSIDMDSKATLYQYLSIATEGLGEYEQSLGYLNSYISMNDSLTINLIDSNIAEVETKYQTEKKEKENLQLKNDFTNQALKTQKATTRNWIFGLLSAIALLSIILIVRYARFRKKNFSTLHN